MKILRKLLVIVVFVVIIINECFAIAVSDNDGSAFITKAEFDSLKNSFQSRIDSYNTSIDSKIDIAIAAYLSGIKVNKTNTIKTGFVVEGNSNHLVWFVGKKSNFNYMNNELYTSDRIFDVFLGTYATDSYFIQDAYDTFAFQGSYSKGNASNYLFVLDKNNYALSSKRNVQMNASRIYIAYSTTNATNGMFWKSITQNLDNPTALTNTSSAGINSNTAKGVGMQRITQTSVYNTLMSHRIYSDNGNPNGGINQPLYKTAEETKNLTPVTQCYDVSITGTDILTNLHWPQGSQYNMHTVNEEWGTAALIAPYNSSRVNYTYTYKLRNCGGVGAHEIPSNFTPTIKGFGLKWKFTNMSMSSIKYKKIKEDWGDDYSYSGGLPLCPLSRDGVFEITLKPNANVRVAFTNVQNETFPAAGDSRLKRCSYRVNGSGNDYTENAAYVDLIANTAYDFKINMMNEKLFFTADMTELTGNCTITQEGDAKLTENE